MRLYSHHCQIFVGQFVDPVVLYCIALYCVVLYCDERTNGIWMRHYAINRKVAGSSHDEITKFLVIHLIFPAAIGLGG
jgi:hypothetical protein